jgi:hypothetical protein
VPSVGHQTNTLRRLPWILSPCRGILRLGEGTKTGYLVTRRNATRDTTTRRDITYELELARPLDITRTGLGYVKEKKKKKKKKKK